MLKVEVVAVREAHRLLIRSRLKPHPGKHAAHLGLGLVGHGRGHIGQLAAEQGSHGGDGAGGKDRGVWGRGESVLRQRGPLSLLALGAAPRGALAHDPRALRSRLSPGVIGWLSVGPAREVTRALQSWRGCLPGCGGRRRRRRQSSYARLARRPHAGAAQCARTPRSQAVRGRRAERGYCPSRGT